jgi:hypothetical protein
MDREFDSHFFSESRNYDGFVIRRNVGLCSLYHIEIISFKICFVIFCAFSAISNYGNTASIYSQAGLRI